MTEKESVSDELNLLKKEVGKLRLQAGLRKALSAELAKQKKNLGRGHNTSARVGSNPPRPFEKLVTICLASSLQKVI